MKQPASYKRIVYISIGSISFILGFLGMFLPLLPTTPFWLLTAYLFLNSSPQLYRRTMEIPVFGKIVRDFQQHRAISKRDKIISISTTWITIILSTYLIGIRWVTILLFIVAAGISWHILSYKTRRDEN